ncbi:MAG: glycosyltransferase family 2 protein [Bacteroidales bacterium]|nr:MAG: glycosyltransferase family 2 protein [Bacteroidales bacterium]
MKVCGFTIVRNAIKYDYPVVESIKSVLPLCDLFVVAVGNSDDGTLELIKGIDPVKIKIIETVWDDSLRKGGQVLAVETNKAFDAIPTDFDWCFYIQADEVIHENSYQTIRNEMEKWLNFSEVEGLLFKYHHFWGTFNYIGVNRQWYRQEIRIVRNNKLIRSYRDAQGFRKNNQKLKVKLIDAYIFHFGWVRPPAIMKEKMKGFSALYLNNEDLQKKIDQINAFNYDEVDAVKRFVGTYPAIMKTRIDGMVWDVNIDEKRIKMSFKDKLLLAIEKVFGYRLFEYKNFIKI